MPNLRNANQTRGLGAAIRRLAPRITLCALLALWLVALTGRTQTDTNIFRPEAPEARRGNFESNVARPLRYWPIDGDFVITNGGETFNRPLYCLNSAFRIDGGDLPEFSLYLPGRGGNLRFGLKTAGGVKWLNEAEHIVTRYRPGSILYTLRDPLLGEGTLDLRTLPMSEKKGFIVRAELKGAAAAELIWAFGGANGMRGSRNGDIGCERQPVSEFFQLRPDECRDNVFLIKENTFELRHQQTVIAGVASSGTKLAVADAAQWNSPAALLASAGGGNSLPVIAGQMDLQPGGAVYLALQPLDADREASTVYKDSELEGVFEAAEAHRRAVAERVAVATPDPFINAAAAALCVAGDAVWDENQKCFMHGAVAWRTRLLGWRGLYTGDALGWHERTAAHFAGFANGQNTNAIPESIPPADEQFNLARNEAALHSNGNLSKNHYDMNLVAVDAFFRHLLWTGDTNYARKMWPVIERHLAWERRLFRREFGPEKLPLYEAYAAIWASDNLSYNGGGAAHASAYNYFENKMAARVAKWLGKDGAPFEREANLIYRAMQKYLWLPEEGEFAEYKDFLALQRAHPNAGLWTFYHAMDSEVPTPAEAWRMSRWIDNNLAHIPIRGPGVPAENLFTLPESSWMPYVWSLNNVVMAEAAHTSLGFWQANRAETAFELFKGELLDSMFMGLCPGNLGCMTSHDMARGEAQRDFADACGINARALVEGLFGVKPDALAGELKISPGFPAKWDHAVMRHPDFKFEFHRSGWTETYSMEQQFHGTMALRWRLAALREKVASVMVNGREAKWNRVEGMAGWPRIEVRTEAAERTEVVVVWRGEAASEKSGGPDEPPMPAPSVAEEQTMDWHKPLGAQARFETVDLTAFFNDQVTRIFQNDYRAPRSPFCSLAMPKQGLGGWCDPNAQFDVDDSGLRRTSARNGGKIFLPDGAPLQTPGQTGASNVIFTSQWENYPPEASVPLTGKARHVILLMAGSTGPMQSRFDNGEVIVTYVDGTATRLALNNPVNWWPIEQDYFIDDYAFRRPEPIPPRVDLRTGRVRLSDMGSFEGRGGKIPGGAATVLDLPLNDAKELKTLTVRALANEVVIGLMSVTLER